MKKGVTAEQIREIIDEAKARNDPVLLRLIMAVVKVCLSANKELEKEMKKSMQDYIEMIFKDELDEKKRKGMIEGELEARTKTVDTMLEMGGFSNEMIAKIAGVTLDFVLERAGQKAV